MQGYVLLAGGAEFGGRMAEVDRYALELAGGLNSPVRILPAAAAPDHNHLRAGANGVRWFKSLGARDVAASPVIDRRSAADPLAAQDLRSAGLIYLLGGFPGYLAETLAGSLAWQAALEACANGAVLGGSSAGAMVLGGQLYDPYRDALLPGLGLLAKMCFLPHHDRFGGQWAGSLRSRLPEFTLLGVDEATGVVGQAGGVWKALGAGSAVVYTPGGVQTWRAGVEFRWDNG
jgi:cyanophycinase